MPFHGESAYEIAVRHGYSGTEAEWIKEIGDMGKAYGFTWYADTDLVLNKNKATCGKLADCMTADFAGAWFYVRTTSSDAGFTAYSSEYTIDGANGFLSLRDYVVWTGTRLVHIPTFEAKASSVKNSDGKYSPKSGVDGLMSSTDKAYLGDIINEYWGKDKLNVFNEPEPKEGWQTNWLFDTGIYLGGIKKDCGGHPPVINENHTSWVIMVFNGMATDADSLNRNHRVQIAFDVVNSKIYMRRGWMSSNTWTDEWTQVGASVAQTKSDTIFVTEPETVALDENIKEIVAEGDVNLNVYLPEKTWLGWRCIINFSEADTIEAFDVGTGENGMFSNDAPWWNKLSAGKTYLLVKTANDAMGAPSAYNMYEVDNITRQIVE